jgi:curli biogenesis system outer membrane secretion channel CsgG
MKKAVFCVIPLLLIIMGCASSSTAAAGAKGGFPGMDLDGAIREAAAQMEAKIPSNTMVALVSVASPSTAFSTQVLTRLESAIVSSGKLVVVDRANLDKVREEQGFQLSGEVDDESAKSIGQLLGAGAIVTGSLADLGDVYSLTLKAINIETATVAVSYLADLAKSARIETLLAGGAGTGPQTARTGGSTAPAAPATVPAQAQAAPAVVPAQTPAAPAAVPAQAPASTYKIGDTGPAGGIVFYDKFSSAGGWRYLEAAPQETEQELAWGSFVNFDGTTTGIGGGKKNTELVVRAEKTLLTAARFCADLGYGGYDDWFLPSKDELDLIYKNLKAKDMGGFSSDIYWASSYSGGWDSGPWRQGFGDGVQSFDSVWSGSGGSNTYRVRAVRQF